MIDPLLPADLLAVLGNLALFLAGYNRLHATGLKRRHLKRMDRVVIPLALGSCLLLATLALRPEWLPTGRVVRPLVDLYRMVCWIHLMWVVFRWLTLHLGLGPKLRPSVNHTSVVDVAARLERLPIAGRYSRAACALPGNQVFRLNRHEEQFQLAELPSALDGLTIAHLSDLHFTGRITREYFDVVVSETNRWNADLVALTGDLIDRVDCLSWIPLTLGRLQARYGVYFILGNHDRRLARCPLSKSLTDCGLVDLGGRHVEIQARGQSLLLAGNELPWFGPAAPLAGVPRSAEDGQLRILLSHSPDQLPWARKRGFQLMLAGHTHGGQIRLPIIGPLVCPSRFGVRYASGLFHRPPTTLHVSRGISGVHPLRFHCPPELSLLTLRSPHRESGPS